MPALDLEQVVLDARATSPSEAFLTLASAAEQYLERMEAAVASGGAPSRGALATRIRGTGPGVSFGSIVAALRSAAVGWICPFEGCLNARGVVLRGDEIVSKDRKDAFLILEFQPHTLDLPLHTHDDSDRFICVMGGRGFFHVSPDPLEAGAGRRLRHTAVRDRDALMFRRGTVHTFSTAEHPLTLLSYHRPYIPLADERQYTLPSNVERPLDFLKNHVPSIGFGSAWAAV